MQSSVLIDYSLFQHYLQSTCVQYERIDAQRWSNHDRTCQSWWVKSLERSDSKAWRDQCFSRVWLKLEADNCRLFYAIQSIRCSHASECKQSDIGLCSWYCIAMQLSVLIDFSLFRCFSNTYNQLVCNTNESMHRDDLITIEHADHDGKVTWTVRQ